MAEVVVVGAGLTGLACARHLVARGHRVEVFERAPAPGGRLRPERWEGFLLEPPGATACRGDAHLEALVADLGGAGVEVVAGEARRAVLHRGGLGACDLSSLRALLRTAPVGPAARARLPWLLLELFRTRRLLDPVRPEAAVALDDRSLAQRLRHLGGEGVAAVLTPALAARRAEAPHEVSAGLGLLALRRLQEAGAVPLRLRGGPGRLVRALADRLPVRVGWEVVGVEPDAGGARVRFVAPSGLRERRADRVVLAVPPAELRRLLPALPAAERSFLDAADEVPPRRAVVLGFEKAPPLPAPALDLPAGPGAVLRELVALHATPGVGPEGAGCVRVRLHDAASDRLADAPDAEVEASVRDALERLPGLALRPDALGVVREAGPRVRYGPGALAARVALHRDAAPGPWVLAEAWRTAGTLEGAAEAGWRAAQAVDAARGA